MEVDENEEPKEETTKFLVEPRPGNGRWASALRIVDPISLKTDQIIQLTDNEAAFV